MVLMSTTDASTPRRVRSILRRIRHWFDVFSRWCLLYITFGGAAGFLFHAPYTSEPSCTPFYSAFGLLDTSCPNEAINLVWSVLICDPRFVIVFPSLAVALFKASLFHGMYNRALDGAVWLILSTPLFLVMWRGMRSWYQENSIFSVLVGLALITEIAFLGFQE